MKKKIATMKQITKEHRKFVIYILVLACLMILLIHVVHLRYELETLSEEPSAMTSEEPVRDTDRVIETLTVYIKPGKNVVRNVNKVETEEKIEEPKETVYPKLYTDEDAIVLAKMVYGEADGVPDLEINGTIVSAKCQKAAVIWTVLNRYDAGYSGTISGVVTAPHQYSGYRSSNPVDEELMDLVIDVLDRWNREKYGETDVGRVLPSDYLWFHGDGRHNHFRNSYKSKVYWDWVLTDPYAD